MLLFGKLIANNKDTWEHKTIHIPPCTDGSWYITDNGRGAFFMFSLRNHSWFRTKYRVGKCSRWDQALILKIGIQGCTVDITGCQLEIGRAEN
ncbi:MAG: hypothetical protein CM15mV142_500 [Caudoviricetes sp.]|nr:MAG: hypothetical protein CM15mV142_500 [Caudoviricetes sp.]